MGIWIISFRKRVLISFLAFIILLFSNSLVYSQWASVTPPSVSADWGLWGLHFTSPTEGWAVGGEWINNTGVLLHYSGGIWTSVPPPSVSTVWEVDGVYFTSPGEGWAVGWDYSNSTNSTGVLLHYSGGTWTSVPPPSYVSTYWGLDGVHFTSSGEGWAVGQDDSNHIGVLFHYSGSTWTSEPPPFVGTHWYLGGVYFTSPTEGWAVGGNYSNGNWGGVLLHYSGSTWTSEPLPSVSTNWHLGGVYFTSPTEGWAVGRDDTNHWGVLLHYSGGTWTSVPPPSVSTDWGLAEVYFISPGEGWAVGWDSINHTGVLLHYSGGMWTSVPPPSVSTGWELDGVYFTSATEGWAVGRDFTNSTGVLLHFRSPISPIEGTIGTEITITGSGFGAKKRKVLVGTVGLKILSWSDGAIVAQLSKAFGAGTYDVTIQPKGASPIVFHDSFSVRSPDIGSVEPQSGSANDQITIQGLFFGTKKGKVTLATKSCKVLSWTMVPTTGVSEIRFVVPKGLSAGTHELIVTTTKVGTDTVDFTVE